MNDGEPIKPLVKTDTLITRLQIVDSFDIAVDSPFQLQEGTNEFFCMATYVDGSTQRYSPFWLLPIMTRSGADFWGVLGRNRKASVSITATKQHERYTELSCWVSPPAQDSPYILHAGIGFDYSLLKSDIQ